MFYLVRMVSTIIPQATHVIHVIHYAQHAVDQAALNVFHALLLNSIKHQLKRVLILATNRNIQYMVQTLHALAATTLAKPAQVLQALSAFLAMEACTSTH